MVFNTFGGGGLLIANSNNTPMNIVGEYGRDDTGPFGGAGVNGAGCGGVEIGGKVYLNAGASASGAGATQSTFTQYAMDTFYPDNFPFPLNVPAPTVIFKDSSNTNTIGNTTGDDNPAPIDQRTTDPAGNVLTGTARSVRRDAHGMAPTVSGHYIHVVDRIQNVMEVYNTGTGSKEINNTSTFGTAAYDLMSADGQGTSAGVCGAMGVTDDAALPQNDPAGDLMATSPNADYLFVALRGPAPVTVNHAAQGSCPGVGVIRLTNHGASGFLEKVIRTSNTLDTAGAGTMTGGHSYTGAERSDIHGVSIRIK